MVSEERMKELIAIKNKQRAASKAEYDRLRTNPYIHARGEGGSIIDSGIQRFMAMEATTLEFFKPHARNAFWGMLTYVVPAGLVMYWVKTSRDEKERRFRSGVVSYRDREFKFI